MKKIAVIVSDGTEELEALTPVDILRRAGATCDIISIYGKTVKGSHGIEIKADLLINEFNQEDYDGIIIPGGMPGAENIAMCDKIVLSLRKMLKEGKLVSAICASPAIVLARTGVVKNKKITCYPAKKFIDFTVKNTYTGKDVEVDGNVITGESVKSAFNFAIKICEYFGLEINF